MKRSIYVLLGVVLFVNGWGMAAAQDGKDVKITILYDNYLHKDAPMGSVARWGFSCMVEGTEKDILFDTGAKPDLLFNNIELLKANVKSIEVVVISHNHEDHTGGLMEYLKTRSDVMVYFPVSAASEWQEKIKKTKVRLVSVDRPIKICDKVWVTGEIKGPVNEQSLIIDTPKGLVVITGCAHPDVTEIVDIVKKNLEKNVYMVLGGFHLFQKSEADIQRIIQRFKQLGVEKVGATHCTGDKAIDMIKKAYGDNYIPIGVGFVLKLEK
jgi:7,8-dihydropterin-6-yl-methyl-4-(beta-D-ribofuranosyl)aminobenzene 5'-phosphate synthase